MQKDWRSFKIRFIFTLRAGLKITRERLTVFCIGKKKNAKLRSAGQIFRFQHVGRRGKVESYRFLLNCWIDMDKNHFSWKSYRPLLRNREIFNFVRFLCCLLAEIEKSVLIFFYPGLIYKLENKFKFKPSALCSLPLSGCTSVTTPSSVKTPPSSPTTNKKIWNFTFLLNPPYLLSQ